MAFAENIVWSPLEYTDAAVVAREAGEGLLERLAMVALQPRVILDAGCGTGEMSARLQARYPDARVLAVDLSEAMLNARQSTVMQTPHFICGDSLQLPLPARSVDLIFANFLLPWQGDFKGQLKEWSRVLRPEGLLMFTAFGPDTLRELQALVASENMPQRMDMHDMGDLLLHAGLSDPVVEMNYCTLSYRQQEKLFAELKATGMLLAVPDEKTLICPTREKYEVTHEIVYGHAWKPAPAQTVEESGVVKIPLSQLRRSKDS